MRFKKSFAVGLSVLLFSATGLFAEKPLFDGKTFAGWEGETTKVWRIENGVIIGGSMDGNPRNEFLATTKPYKNFVLKFEYKLTGTEGFVNGGVQFHSQRLKEPANEMIGYQADIGGSYTGFLQDESRRKTAPANADRELVKKIEKTGEWNRYEIHANNGKIRLLVNGTETVNYTEPEAEIPQTGYIALQIHGNCKAVIEFKNLIITELPD